MRWRALLWRPRNVVLLLVLVGLLVGLTVATGSWIEVERERIAKDLSRDRFRTLSLITDEIEEEMQDVIDDLRFARRLVNTSRSRRDLRRPLVALLGNSRAYRAVILLGKAGRQYLYITSPRRPLPASDELDAVVQKTVTQASRAGRGALEISPAVTVSGESFRVFAVPHKARERSPQVVAVALIVDMKAHFGKLRIAYSNPRTELLILGPVENISPASTKRVRRAVRRSKSRARRGRTFRKLLRQMRSGQHGTSRIPAAEASRLGLGNAEQVAVYMPIRVRGSRYWAVATITSLASTRKRERGLMLRFGVGALSIALLLLGFTAFLLRGSYRQAVLGERVRAAEEIAHLHGKAAKILASIPTGVLVLGEHERVTDLNRAMAAWLPETAPGARLDEAFARADPDTVTRLTELIRRAVETRAATTFVGEHLSLFGTLGHYRLHGVPLSPPRPEAQALLVVEDITELKTLEEQLLRTEKLATIGTLAAGIAHEIGTPLSVVRGRTERALSKLGAEHPEAAGLRIVIEQTDRVVRTVRELLDFSRMHQALPTAVRLEDVVGRSVELLRYEATRRKIRVSVDLAESLPPVSADADQLQQVIVNLLMNAFDAAPTDSEVVVEARLADPPPDGSSTAIRLAVVDEGAGISQGDAHRILDPFYTTKKRGQGTGLGLFIVSQILRSHGATISFGAGAGRGTRVVVDWPIHQEQTDVDSA